MFNKDINLNLEKQCGEKTHNEGVRERPLCTSAGMWDIICQAELSLL